MTIVAERAAWIRVYLDNGTVIFESILEKGQSYTPPEGTDVPMIWAGNSGSVYAKIGDTLYGPLGRGTRAAKDISLAPQAITDKFTVVTEVPEVISQSIGVVPADGGAGRRDPVGWAFRAPSSTLRHGGRWFKASTAALDGRSSGCVDREAAGVALPFGGSDRRASGGSAIGRSGVRQFGPVGLEEI